MPVSGFLEGMYDVKERQAHIADIQALSQLRQAEAATSIENLQTQRQTRQILQKFLGQSDPQTALAQDDPRQVRQMNLVGDLLIRSGDAKLGLQFKDKASEVQHRAVIDMRDAIAAQQNRRKVLGGILGAVESPEGYPDAVQEFLNQGGSLKEIPWYTGDWEKDKVHVQQYAKSSMAADVQAQRALGALNAGLREDELSRRTARDAEMAREAAQRAEQAARNEDDRQRARDRAVARKTIGLPHEEKEQVKSILIEDDRLNGMSEGMIDAVTSMIGNRVKQRRQDAPDADFKELVDDELDSAIEKGEIVPGKQAPWWDSFIPGREGSTKPKLGRVKSDAGIDLSRPIISNPDGSFSTERTITIEEDGKYYNIPTIVGGKQRSSEEAIRLFHSGDNPAVGTFKSQEDAETAARARSKRIGEVRKLAPPAAISYLKAHPELKEQFRAKYGYVPE